MNFEKLARVALVLALAFILFMALSPSPPVTPIDRFGDKVEHMTAFGSLLVLARLSFPLLPAWVAVERLAFFGALIEVFQAIPSLHRSCDWRDWVADVAALTIANLGYGLAQTFQARFVQG
jgi:hypothetical protein